MQYRFIIQHWPFAAMSHLREAVEDISSQSKVKLNFQAPEEIIEDHTHEMVRVKFKVRNMCKTKC